LSQVGRDIALDPDRNFYLRYLIKKAIRNADLLHTGDIPGKRRLIDLGAREQKIVVHAWGFVRKYIDRKNVQRKLQKKNGIINIISLKKLAHKYDVETVVRAAPLIIQKNNNVRFIITNIGPQRKELEDLVAQLGVQKYFVFTGLLNRKEVGEYLYISDIYIDAMNYLKPNGAGRAGTGHGISIAEAMAASVVPIAAERPGIRDVLPSNMYDLIYHPGSAENLAQNVLKIINNRKRLLGLKKQVKLRADEIGDWDAYTKYISSFYPKLVQ